MKVKLLKKVRKRFSIYYNAKGHYFDGEHYKKQYMLIDAKDKQNTWFSNDKNVLIDTILETIRDDYPKGTIFKSSKKIWY